MKKEEFVKIGVFEELAVACEKTYLDELKDFLPRMRMNMVTSIGSLHKIWGYNLLGFAWRTTGVLLV